jgi:hypothetical protein
MLPGGLFLYSTLRPTLLGERGIVHQHASIPATNLRQAISDFDGLLFSSTCLIFQQYMTFLASYFFGWRVIQVGH